MNIRKGLLSLALLAGIAFGASAQSQQNALDFDGVDDRVMIPNASGFITSGTGITLSCWVYPTNAAPAYPDFDGFAGFRNESNCDFYMIQIGAGTVEGRFRNSSNSVVTITCQNLTLNAWNHMVLSYNGSNLTMYKDGAQVATAAASGSVSNASVPLYIGNVQFNTVPFLLTGKVDDVGLWNKGLSATEVSCVYTNGISPNSTGLQLYYKFNQSIANGANNVNDTTATDVKGNMAGSLQNFGLMGTSSNWVAGRICNIVDSARICAGSSIRFGNQTITQAGTYIRGAASSTGCDSVIELTVSTGSNVNKTVTLVGTNILSVAQTGAQYQWVDCNNGKRPISGATSRNYIAPADGSYACIVKVGQCSDTSLCTAVTKVGTFEIAGNLLTIYPNPANDFATVSFDSEVMDATISVYDLSGKQLVRMNRLYGNNFRIETANLPKGIYLVKIETAEGVATQKLAH